MIEKNKLLICLLILFTVYNSFFLNKAFHIDDPFTILMAREINKNFFIEPSIIYSYSPPLLGYYYAPIIKLFGEKEVWLHIFHLPFSLLVIISMYFLCQRFAEGNLLPLIFLVVTPAFVVMSHNIMLDIPLLSFILSSLAAFSYGSDNKKKGFLILSGLLAACACLTKYSGLVLIPILIAYSLLFPRKYNYLYLIIPMFAFFLWVLHIVLIYKQPMIFYASLIRLILYLTNENLAIRALFCLIFITGTSIITLFLSPYLLGNRTNKILFLASLPFGLYSFLVKIFSGYSLLGKLIIVFLLTSAVFIILIIFKVFLLSLYSRGYNKDRLFLSLWFFIYLLFTILSNFIAARFVLLLFPPMLLLMFNEINFYLIQKTKKIISFFILVTISLTTLLAIGDYNFAGVYRRISIDLKQIKPQNEQIYFYGGDWGYYYYMIKEGYEPLIDRDRLSPQASFRLQYYSPPALSEDLLSQKKFIIVPNEPVLPSIAFGERESLFKELARLRYVRILTYHTTYYGNIILHNRKFHAGFYSHGWGILPFSLSLKKKIIESFKIYNLRYLTD